MADIEPLVLRIQPKPFDDAVDVVAVQLVRQNPLHVVKTVDLADDDRRLRPGDRLIRLERPESREAGAGVDQVLPVAPFPQGPQQRVGSQECDARGHVDAGTGQRTGYDRRWQSGCEGKEGRAGPSPVRPAQRQAKRDHAEREDDGAAYMPDAPRLERFRRVDLHQ